MKTHSFLQRTWGHDFIVVGVEAEGQRIQISGWCIGIQVGDLVVLPNGDDAKATYRVEQIEYEDVPKDMFFARLAYAPQESKVG